MVILKHAGRGKENSFLFMHPLISAIRIHGGNITVNWGGILTGSATFFREGNRFLIYVFICLSMIYGLKIHWEIYICA